MRPLPVTAIGSALFLTAGGVLLAVGILDLRETQRLQAEGELIRGKVTGRHWSARGRPYSLDVELQTRAGVRVTLAESVGRGRYERTKPGDTVPLHYLASDPSVMKIVPDAGELAALKPGDLITATLVVVRDDIHLDDIKKVVAARE